MIRRIRFLCCALGMLGLFTSASQGATMFTLLPPSGMVSGPPGSVVGFGFTITNTTNFLEVTGSNFVPASPIGTYTDFNSIRANPIIVGPSPESPVLSESFNASAVTGMGSFTINGGANTGDMALGSIVITFDLFSRSPNDPSFNRATDRISTNNMLSASAKVTVSGSSVPEPSSIGMIALSGIGLYFLRRRVQGTSSLEQAHRWK